MDSIPNIPTPTPNTHLNHFNHFTLNTNHSRSSPRSEVCAEAIALCTPLLLPGTHPLPGFPGLSCWTFHLGPAHSTLIIGDSLGKLIIAHLAWSADAAKTVWPITLKLARAAGAVAEVIHLPDPPWLAVMLAPGILGLPPEWLPALADFERCWAWAVLESLSATPSPS